MVAPYGEEGYSRSTKEEELRLVPGKIPAYWLLLGQMLDAAREEGLALLLKGRIRKNPLAHCQSRTGEKRREGCQRAGSKWYEVTLWEKEETIR